MIAMTKTYKINLFALRDYEINIILMIKLTDIIKKEEIGHCIRVN